MGNSFKIIARDFGPLPRMFQFKPHLRLTLSSYLLDFKLKLDSTSAILKIIRIYH